MYVVLGMPPGNAEASKLVRIEGIRRLWWPSSDKYDGVNGSAWILYEQLYNDRTAGRAIPAERPLHHYDIYTKLAAVDVCPLDSMGYRVRRAFCTAHSRMTLTVTCALRGGFGIGSRRSAHERKQRHHVLPQQSRSFEAN